MVKMSERESSVGVVRPGRGVKRYHRLCCDKSRLLFVLCLKGRSFAISFIMFQLLQYLIALCRKK